MSRSYKIGALEHAGTFEGGVARSKLRVVPGTATGELRGLRGEGRFAATHAKSNAYALDYEFG